jgi:hypothetical protein
MSLVKIALLAASISLACVAGANAQVTPPAKEPAATGTPINEPAALIPEGSAVVLHPTMKGRILKVGKKGHAEILSKGRELPAGAAIYRKGGKLYIYEPPANTTGKELFDRSKYWQDDIG